MRITSAYFGALALGSSLLFSTAAFAAPSGCYDNNGGNSGNFAAYNPSLLNITFMNGWPLGGVVNVPATATPGTVLLTMEHNSFPNLDSLSQYEASKYIAYANCTPGRVENFRVQGLVTGLDGVYRMNGTDNIGYRVNYPGWPAVPQNTLSFTAGVGNQGTTAYPGGGGANLFMLYPPVGTMRVEYVLLDTTWPAARQVTISGTLARVDVDGVGAGQLLRYNPFPVTFRPEPCYFTSNRVINVTLNPVDSDQFTGTGTTIGTAQVPLLQMRCSDANATPKIKITGTSDDSNTPGVLKNLAPAGDRANGVAILLEHNPGNTTAFPVDLHGNTTTSAPGLVDGGTCGSNCRNWSLPLQASYYSTTDTIESGKVQAQATVEVQYP